MNEKNCWDILDIYFQQGNSQDSVNPLVKHQIDSYNKFLDNTLSQIIVGFNPIKINLTNKSEVEYNIQKISINVLQPSLTKPLYQLNDGTQTIMTPYIARMNNLTYSSNLYVNVYISIEILNKDNVIEKIDKTVNNVYIGKIPIMVRSKSCVLYQIPGLGEEDNNECRYDFGGYFIVNGNEKVLICQDRINENTTLVFHPNNNSDGLYAEIRSMSDNVYLPPKTTSLNMSKKLNHMGRIIRLNTSFIRSEIPVFLMFKVLGVVNDKEIIEHIVYDLDDPNNKKIINELMACCEDSSDINTKEEAEQILIKIMTGINKNTKPEDTLRNNIVNDFLPHVGKSYHRKALYLGYMIRKMIRIYLGYEDYDNRDNYINKRIDTPGVLMSNLFRQCYGKMTKEIKNLIEKELNLWRANQTYSTLDIISDNNIHRYFKQSPLDSWLKYSLSTGNWGIKSIGSFQNIRQGVSQVLNRMSYASTLSHLRRFNTPMERNAKMVQPRKLDITQFGMICPAECFDPNTPILLWDGTIKKAEDIIIGDYLINDEGNSVRVKSTCSGIKRMYEVIPHKKNFINYTVTDNHILTLKIRKHKLIRKNGRGKKEFKWFDKKELKYKNKTFNNIEDLNEFSLSIDDDNVIDITIEKYLSLPINIQKQLYIFKSNGINWETKEVALDPYILGMWLGDGFSCGYGFATNDKELLDEWIKWGVNNDATITKAKSNKYRYYISSTINNTQPGISCNKTESAPLKKLLAKYNLVKNKHIPLDYLTNDRKTRLSLLAGLIDTDGSVRANGHEIRICQGDANYKIIYDAEFLARSLGFSCHLNDGMCSYTVNGEKRKKPYKELSITGKNLYEIPTVLPRKKLNKFNDTIIQEKRSDSFLQSSFELIQKDVQKYVGWQLEGNGRFLLGDMSITHNTPEGSSVGLVKNMALSTCISVSMNSTYIRKLLEELGTIIYDDTKNTTEFLKKLGNCNNVYVQINGDIIGYHEDPHLLYTKLKHYKRCGIIYPITSIIWDIKHHYIGISTEAGRMYRPLFIVDYENNKSVLRINKILKEKNLSFKDYIKDKKFEAFVCPIAGRDHEEEEEGFIEYLDLAEINHCMIAMKLNYLDKGMKGNVLPPRYTHCEIHPSLMNGILGVNIPFSDHNQSPRNCYQCIYENELVLMSNGTSKKIKDIKIGDNVICFNPETNINEYTEVVFHYNRITNKKVFNILTISGRSITATFDHKFMTYNGWKRCNDFDETTLIGIQMMSKYVSNDIEEEYVILNEKNLILMPLLNNNIYLPIISRLVGYYYNNNELKFNNSFDKEEYNKDIIYIGFTNGIYNTSFNILMMLLSNNLEWLFKCSKLVQREFIAGYYGSNNNEITTNDIIKNLLIENSISLNWNNNENNYEMISNYYNIFGIRYNNELMVKYAIINEYYLYTKSNYRLNINKPYNYNQFRFIIRNRGNLLFIPYHSKIISNNKNISDITVSSDNHSFIAGNGFAVSNCAMGKQALGIHMSNFNKRIDTMGNILNYPQKPLVYTKLSKYTYSNELPSGVNTIVAIMTHSGFNQEDSVMINQSALDRGLFTSTYYKAFRDQCNKNHSTGEEEIFTNPTNLNVVKPFSYEKLGEDGFIPKNTYIDDNDIIVGKVMPKKINGKIYYNDNSNCMKSNDDGYIDLNYTGINSEGYKFCKIRIRKNRKPEIGDKLACYSPDHEYLTTDGWIPVSELTLKHKIATLVDNKLVYQHPSKLHEFDYEGKMYSVETNHVSLLVTPNHRMYIRGKNTGSSWNVKLAEEIYHTRHKYKKNVDEWIPDYEDECCHKNLIIKDNKITHYSFEEYIDGNNKLHPELIVDIDDWITIYGIYIAEGTCYKSGISIAANKERVRKPLDEINEKGKIKITINMEKGEPVKRNICCVQMSRDIGLGHIAITKYLDEWVWWLDREQSQKLVQSMCLGDGGMMDNGTWRYYTSSTRLADDFQRLCLQAGFSCNKKLKTPKGTRNLSLEKLNKERSGREEVPESYTNADYWVLTIITSQNEPIVNKNMVSENHPKFNEYKFQDEWVDYKGKVYCCTVGDKGIIYVRRNGAPIWCLNSRSAQKGTIGMIYRHQDMPFTKDGIVPDIIMNPHAIPSRMTMAQLMECIMGKASCNLGTTGDATPYNDCTVENIAKILETSGMERYGNEILYNGRTGEQIKTEIFIGPTYYQRLKHMVQDKLHCLKEDHEVLTTEGWKFIKEISKEDYVATLKDGKLVYEKPLQVFHYPNYKGKMYRIKNQAVDLDVTIDHRMYISTCHTRQKIWSEYKLEKAEDIVGKLVKYKRNAEWDVSDYQFILNDKNVNMDSWITFFGIWIAEGWIVNNSYRINIDIHKNRVKDVLYNAINDLGYTYNICNKNERLEINNKELYNYLDTFDKGSSNKKLPEWVWQLSKIQAQKLVYSMQLGNGCFSRKTNSSMYYTSSEKLSDDFMRLLLHAGWSGMKTIHIKAGECKVQINNRNICNNYNIWRISVIKSKNEPCVNHSHSKNQNIQEECVYDYEGSVYCISVPSEVFYIRRNGKPIWTGNSRGSNGPIVMLTRQCSEGRARNGGLRLGEMERDCFIGHGSSTFLKEKMLDSADNYRVFICKNCGMIANVNPDKNIYKCNNCKNISDIVQIRIPYAFKLLSQELYTMNVLMRFVCN